MKRALSLSLILALSACSAPVGRPTLPQTFDASPAASARGFAFPEPGVVEFPERAFSVARVDGPLVLPRAPVCDNSETLLQTLQVSHSCSATGNFAFFSNGANGPSTLATFVHSLRASGYTVDLGQGGITITGQGTEAAAVADVQGNPPDEVAQPAGTGVVMFDELAFQADAATARAVASPSFAVRRFRADPASAEAINILAAENGLNVTASPLDGRVAVFGDAPDVALAVAAFGFDESTISAEVGPMSDEAVGALREAFPDLVISYDPDASVLYVRGSPEDLQQSAASVRNFTRQPSQIRSEVIFAAYRSRDGFAASSGISGAALTSVQGGTLSVPIDSDLSAVLSLVETRGEVSILSQPVLTSREGVEASFVSASQVPIPRTVIADGVVTQDFEYLDAGTLLGVTARLTRSGLIALDIRLELSSVSAATPPTFDRRTIETAITVAPGQSVALAGLATLENRRDVEGFPIIRAIGGSFSRANSRDELVIFVRPTLHGVAGSTLRDSNF
jgi:type II secretory pathway component GspD/PulD (secretin)